jgi:hypothetical protein
LGADDALQQALALQAVNDAPDRGPIEADGRSQTGLVDTGALCNALERGKLYRSQVETRRLRLGLEDLH